MRKNLAKLLKIRTIVTLSTLAIVGFLAFNPDLLGENNTAAIAITTVFSTLAGSLIQKPETPDKEK